MLVMSFYNGTLNRDVLEEFIKNTDKPIKFTYGYKWKGPTTYFKDITKEEALHIARNESLLDVTENERFIDMNAYSGNDMW